MNDIDRARANNAIKYDTLSPAERDFLQILPEQYREAAFTAYKDYRKVSCFTSVFERSKMCTAFMSGFVTAVFIVRNIDEPEVNAEAVTPEIPGQ